MELFEEFRQYLVEKGYKEKTPSGKPSTVEIYVNIIKKVILEEQMEGINLMDSIDEIVNRYDVGEKSETGHKNNNKIISALRAFRNYVCEIGYLPEIWN